MVDWLEKIWKTEGTRVSPEGMVWVGRGRGCGDGRGKKEAESAKHRTVPCNVSKRGRDWL